MTSSIDWTVVSAVVQAASALLIVGLTFFLVRFTRNYVREMARSNELQDQANTISSGLLARATRETAPFLVAVTGGGGGSQGGGADYRMTVQNRGGGLAHDIKVETTWGEAPIDSLGAGDKADITVHTDRWNAHERPQAIRFRFKDAQGKEWIQGPNQIPVEA